MSGGCFSEDYRDVTDVGMEQVQRYQADGAVLMAYNFQTCNQSSCNNYSPEGNIYSFRGCFRVSYKTLCSYKATNYVINAPTATLMSVDLFCNKHDFNTFYALIL